MSEKLVAIGEDERRLTVDKNVASWDDKKLPFEIVRIGDEDAELIVDGRSVIVPFILRGETVSFSLDGQTFTATVTQGSQGKRARHREHSMSAPMPGVVLKIFANAGDVVAKGAPLVILEAMKMEHQITAPHDGVVKAVRCTVGELVQPGMDLIELANE